jgi:hypothetical protein
VSTGAETTKGRLSLRGVLPIGLYGLVGGVLVFVGVNQRGALRVVELSAGLVGLGIAILAVMSLVMVLMGYGIDRRNLSNASLEGTMDHLVA